MTSPIAHFLSLRAEGSESVVGIGGLSLRQRALYTPTALDDALLELASRTDAPAVICVTGSAGGGKSGLVENIRARAPHLFSAIVEDATHSESPSVDQATTLANLLSPLADGAEAPPKPILIAANTGMLVALFDEFDSGHGHSFSALRSALLGRLGIEQGALPETPTAAVLNLDDRPTAGSEDSLLRTFLAAVDPARPEGPFGPGDCEHCAVRDWCPVYTNAALASGAAAPVIDALVAGAAAVAGRHPSPRTLWDFVSQIVAPLSYESLTGDHCDAVRGAADREDRAWVVERLLPASLFAAAGALGRQVARRDPSREPSSLAYDVIAGAGLRPDEDAAAVRAVLGAEPRALALDRAAELVECTADVPGFDERGGWRTFLGRFLVACSALTEPDAWGLDGTGELTFDRALDAYTTFVSTGAIGEDGEALAVLPGVLERGLAAIFGTNAGGSAYLPVKAYDPRDRSRIFVRVELRPGQGLDLVPAQPVRHNADGASIVGYRPLGITFDLAGTEVVIDAPMFDLLHLATTGTLAATADAPRFFALRRAAEALARRSAKDRETLLVEEPSEQRRYTVREVATLAGTTTLEARPA